MVKILIENKYLWLLSWDTGQDPHSSLDPQWLGKCLLSDLPVPGVTFHATLFMLQMSSC